jgi:hypothetical protein
VSANRPSFIEELAAAAMGTSRILFGRRDAASYFALDLRGLAGSFIALLLAVTINLVLTALIVQDPNGPTSFETLIGNVALYGMQIAATWVVLRWIGKSDYFTAYLTVDNWVTFFLSTILAVLGLIGLGGEMGLILAGIVTIVAKVNIARIVLELRAMHIVLLIVGQTVGGFLGLMLVGVLLGGPTLPPPA